MRKRKLFSLLLFSSIFFCCSFLEFASAATLYNSPSVSNVLLGQAVTVNVYVSSIDQAVNAVSGSLNFPADKLEVLGLSKSGSVVNLWVQEPSFSNVSGTINFEGIVLNPGFTGSAGKIISVQFRAKGLGNASVSFASGSILANDGQGTSVLKSLSGAEIKIQQSSETPGEFNSSVSNPSAPGPVQIISSTHPDPDQWYGHGNLKVSWRLGSDITGVKTLLDKLPRSQPTLLSDHLINEKEALDLGSGVWYFHLQLKNNHGWGSVSHFKIQIDTIEPEFLNIEFVDNRNDLEILPSIRVSSKDSLSGIDYYLVKLGDPVGVKVLPDDIETKDYPLSVEEPGPGMVIVEALDMAGNSRVATKDFSLTPIEAPVFEEYPRFLDRGGVLIVSGSSYPETKIRFKILRDDTESDSQSTISDGSGHFSFVLADRVVPAVYKVSAQAVKANGQLSFYTEPLLIPVRENLWHYLTSSFLSIIGLLTLLIGMATLFFHVWQHFSRKKAVDKEVHEAKLVLLREFRKLKAGTQKQVDLLESIKQGRKLSFEERMLLEDLSQVVSALIKAEKLIKKEIEDINQI